MYIHGRGYVSTKEFYHKIAISMHKKFNAACKSSKIRAPSFEDWIFVNNDFHRWGKIVNMWKDMK